MYNNCTNDPCFFDLIYENVLPSTITTHTHTVFNVHSSFTFNQILNDLIWYDLIGFHRKCLDKWYCHVYEKMHSFWKQRIIHLLCANKGAVIQLIRKAHHRPLCRLMYNLMALQQRLLSQNFDDSASSVI